MAVKKSAKKAASKKARSKKATSKTAASKKTVSTGTTGKKKVAKKKTAAKKKAKAASKQTGANRVATAKKAQATATKPKPKGGASSMTVNLGHVFALRPRVSTTFRQADFTTAKHQLQDELYKSIEEAARAVAEKALELTHGGPAFGRRRDRH
jgi:GH24 family phage-related lysozyme (muramidase)